MSDTQEKLAELTQAVADLTKEASALNERSSTAVEQAEGEVVKATEQADRSDAEADRSTAQATIATSGANTATTQAGEAKAARDEAVSVVHNDEGSLTPKPGAYAVADSNGHFDINWTPLLAAMYPYSGVLGSVNKDDMFTFQQNTAAVDRFYIKGKRAFNIFGRFVNISKDTGIQVQETESTAERAIAFDDIFLDWNGNVTPYRSITPHRTTTSFDRDAIAEEHGYTKVQKGLYKIGDTFALLLGRVARLNQGAFHPVFNPEGARWPLASSSTVQSWFQERAIQPVNRDEPFNLSGATEGLAVAGGYLASGSVDRKRSGRPDGKFYDVIYADDFTPLYYSAKNVVDHQALLFDSFNRAVAGETFSGAELYGAYKVETVLAPNTSGSAPLRNTGIVDHTLYLGQRIIVENKNDKKLFLARIDTIYGSDTAACRVLPVGYDSFQDVPDWDMTGYTASWSSSGKTNIYFYNHPLNNQVAARPQFLMVDIIGSQDAMPDEWKEHGVPGNWLAVGEEGESLIPDGTSKNYKLSRKCLECYQVLSTEDKGVSWTDVTADYKTIAEGSGNTLGNLSTPSAALRMVFYRTSANPFESADSGQVDSLGGVIVSNSHFTSGGSIFGGHLLNKIPTANSGVPRTVSPALKSCGVILNGLLYAGGFASDISHESVNLTSESSGYKVSPYLSRSYMHVIYKELKHNGTQWGDDNKFNIVDKNSTVTDLNGETVIVGQKRVELPYQFDGEQY